MAQNKIDKLIINSPYEEPKYHWSYDRDTRLFTQKEGRRSAGYVIASESSKAFDDPGTFIEIPLVNKIRPRIKKWRESGYPGVTGITKRLLEHWHNPEEREYRLFFCQLEAIETLIWIVEAPDADKVGIDIPSDGGKFRRLCSKMATGSGKTIVMAMLIAWQILNKVTYPQDNRFSKNVFIVAPGLTVKSRLQVLIPSSIGNYYDEFSVVPAGLLDKLRQGKILICNWHVLNWETEEQLAKKKSVDKRGAKSNEAYVREVLEDMANSSNIIVINDEAHHAWRVPAESKTKGVKKEEIEEATIWVNGLDRIHEARNILNCYDFSATPMAPSGKKSSEEALFDWIISDFGLNDAIESGLVKTPRVVIRDDGKLSKDYKSRFYHIYNDPEVKDNINRKAEEHDPLPDLVINGYYLLGKDWLETKERWENQGFKTPPVMISVANRTETAARIKYAFDHKKIRIDELCIPERTLHIDSKVLAMAEANEQTLSKNEMNDDEESIDEPTRKLSKAELAEHLRKTVDTVGQIGKPGEQIQKVISVGMLSEGWDAKTVTQIMGLRAFSSQLLCEQVVGRGLRRTSYEVNPVTFLFDAEYVNIFGVPFTFLPHEIADGPQPKPPDPKNRVEPVFEKRAFEIKWPNVIRIEHVYRPNLTLDMVKVKTLELNAYDTAMLAELAPVIEGKPDVTKISTIDLENLGKKFRMQKIIFETARDVFDQMKPTWKADKTHLLVLLISLVEKFINSEKIQFLPFEFKHDDLKRRVLLTLNMNRIVQHIWEAIRFENTESTVPIFDKDHPIRSTGDMRTWYTGKPCECTKKSHINVCVFDSKWEASEAFELDRNKNVEAWVKNDHLGFEIFYVFEGVVKKYRPDFIIKLKNGTHLVLETKGQDTQQDKTKREFLKEWIEVVNCDCRFGTWSWAVSKNPKDVPEILGLNF
ncbi:MAG: type III restriction endonuclease subunit R [Candidatus Schekmanbacteria bacterium RBG_13_48_7]|uniref:Type III restriction endonuclease subunit R n=1 Tax=Candidatus Schekmanbacteria bacterium RBG_13_48_7 TaxID=1817878 RepID=A0A1F7S3Q4_9BACT|nr:MAG: type III restriction endonuclease subunit R [Candidatus Schekmanbacteria bacterium RBG_13_48_7]